MAKAPRLGLGKSRLARELGRSEAWRINRWLHRMTMRVAVDRRWRTVLAVAPASAVRLTLPSVWPRGLQRLPQGPGDLGDRMRRVLRGIVGPVAVIGADCPELKGADIAAAFRALAMYPAAIGLTEVGGFWIAVAKRARILDHAFRNVRWSSAETAMDVRARLPRHRVLRTLQDVDTPEDLRAVRARLSARARRHA